MRKKINEKYRVVIILKNKKIMNKNNGRAILTLYSLLRHSFNTVTWLSFKFYTNPVGCHSGTGHCYGSSDVIKPWPSNFNLLISFVPQFLVFKTFTWLGMKFSTNPVCCDGGTSCRYGNNDIFCPPKMAKWFWPAIPLCATVSIPALSHDSPSYSP